MSNLQVGTAFPLCLCHTLEFPSLQHCESEISQIRILSLDQQKLLKENAVDR